MKNLCCLPPPSFLQNQDEYTCGFLCYCCTVFWAVSCPIVLIHSTVNRHSDCFHSLSPSHNIAMIFRDNILWWAMFLFCLAVHRGVGLLGHTVTLCSVLYFPILHRSLWELLHPHTHCSFPSVLTAQLPQWTNMAPRVCTAFPQGPRMSATFHAGEHLCLRNICSDSAFFSS